MLTILKAILVQEAAAKKTASPLQILEFQNGCVVFLQNLSFKLIQRCPLKYPVVRHLVSLEPSFIAKKPEAATRKFENFLQHIISGKLKIPSSCDTALQQYKAFVREVIKYKKEEFSSYNASASSSSFDVFFQEHIGDNQEYAELWSVVKQMLIFSHGQSCRKRFLG